MVIVDEDAAAVRVHLDMIEARRLLKLLTHPVEDRGKTVGVVWWSRTRRRPGVWLATWPCAALVAISVSSPPGARAARSGAPRVAVPDINPPSLETYRQSATTRVWAHLIACGVNLHQGKHLLILLCSAHRPPTRRCLPRARIVHNRRVPRLYVPHPPSAMQFMALRRCVRIITTSPNL